MKVEDFNYNLPEELIAQKPADKREESRMMVVERKSGKIFHAKFKDILDFLTPKDLIVINNSKVFPARLFGKKDGGNAKIEVLLIREIDEGIWKVLLKPAKRMKIGGKVVFKEGIRGKVLHILDDGSRVMKFNLSGEEFFKFIFENGKIPLPPYIKEAKKLPEDFHRKRYQTVFAKKIGSVAAPTAGLHFSDTLLNKIKNRGINVCEITLHVGPGTFKPVTTSEIEKHKMDEEFYMVEKKTAEKINLHKKNGGKILAVGTTTTRTLETIALNHGGTLQEEVGFTNLFIYPPFKFKIVDKLLTNFHLPKSTLLMLVSAFASKELIMKAYSEAVEKKYRFYSYGDCMLIL